MYFLKIVEIQQSDLKILAQEGSRYREKIRQEILNQEKKVIQVHIFL